MQLAQGARERPGSMAHRPAVMAGDKGARAVEAAKAEARLQQAGAKGHALKELVERERCQQGADGAGGVAHAERNPDQHRVEGNAGLQHLRTHAASAWSDMGWFGHHLHGAGHLPVSPAA